jgi:hypothetical protein
MGVALAGAFSVCFGIGIGIGIGIGAGRMRNGKFRAGSIARRADCHLLGARVPGKHRKILFERGRAPEGQSVAAAPNPCHAHAGRRTMVVGETLNPITKNLCPSAPPSL